MVKQPNSKIRDNLIMIRTQTEEEKLILDAAKIVGLPPSSFARIATIEKSRLILKENLEEIPDGKLTTTN